MITFFEADATPFSVFVTPWVYLCVHEHEYVCVEIFWEGNAYMLGKRNLFSLFRLLQIFSLARLEPI